jgi:hypothetical protein
MSLLDDAFRRYLVLKILADEESVKVFADPLALRHIDLLIVELGDEQTIAQQKLEAFFEELGRRMEETAFLDHFVAFETLLNALRITVRRRRGRRLPAAKGLAGYLKKIDVDLAEEYELVRFERNEIAHHVLSPRILVAPIDQQKTILERVLAAIGPAGSRGGP